MRHVIAGRLIAVIGVVVLLGVALAATNGLNPLVMSVAQAQTEPVTTVNGILLPPPVPGLDYPPVATETNESVDSLVLPSTPTAPVLPGDAAALSDVPATSDSMTTSLGGSDVAVSSVGGSYEVDGPKKRSHRKK